MRSKVILILLLYGSPSGAAPLSQSVLKIIYRAAAQYGIDAQDLIHIAFTESRFNQKARRVNANGTVDWGMFQINSVHWTTTCRGLDVSRLQGNAQCAAKIISRLEARHGQTDVNWLGRYHSATPSKKRAYKRRLAAAEVELGSVLRAAISELRRCEGDGEELIEDEEELVLAASREKSPHFVKQFP